jgi:HSP20 family molecular chaperone IbpA
MSRMTLLDGNLWLSLSPQRAEGGAAKTGEAAYPPYNIELLGKGEALRITLAVAGFRLEELEVSIEDGELTVRGKQREGLSPPRHRGAPIQAELRPRQWRRGG